MNNRRGREHIKLVSWQKDGGPTYTGGNEPPSGDGMDQRILNLENNMTDVKVAIGKVETRLDTIERTMLTRGQAAVYSLVSVLAMLGAGWWVVQQYLAPILAGIPA